MILIASVPLDERSPWFPLAVASLMQKGKPPGRHMPQFEHWIAWHRGFRILGKGFQPITAEQAAALFQTTA